MPDSTTAPPGPTPAEYEAAEEALNALAPGHAGLADPNGVLRHEDFDADRRLFALVKARADRLQTDCAEARRRNALMSGKREIPALLKQAVDDLKEVREKLQLPDHQARLDRLVARIEDARDSVDGFLAPF